MKLETKYIVFVSFVIVSFSAFFQIFRSTRYNCYPKVLFIKEKAVLINRGIVVFSGEEWFFESLIKTVLGIWIPILIVASCYMVLFIRLRQQVLFRSRSSSNTSSNAQTQILSRTFSVIVLAFFICMLPGTSIWLHYTYQLYTRGFNIKMWHSHQAAIDISWAVTNLNCCLNPFIYGKLHRKLWTFIKGKFVCQKP